MTRHQLATGYEVTVLLSTAAALLVGLRELAQRPPPDSHTASCGARWAHPLAQLGLVCVLLFVNQLLFNAYVLRVHGGSAFFLQRYLGPGWCVLEQGALVQRIAALSGDGRWMAPSVLRVQAFLELPFTLFAYLTVARGLSSRVYRSLTRLSVLFLASLSFTSAFCLAEIGLANPWTTDDLVLRGIACAIVPLYVEWTARHHGAPSDEGAPGLLGLLVFLAGAGAIAVVVLVAYDVLLLYNLGHLRQYGGVLAMGALLATLTASRTGKGPSEPRSPSLTACHGALAAFTMLFFVPSLAIRYWSFHSVARICGLLLVALALGAGLFAGIRARSPLPTAVRLLAWIAGFASGVFSASVVASTMRFGELALALGALAFLVPTIVVSRGVELLLASAARPLRD